MTRPPSVSQNIGKSCKTCLTSLHRATTLLAMMRLKIARALIVLSLVFAIGGHWAFLQSVAWLGMTVKFAQSDTLSGAIRKTFDGLHPCKICKIVREGKDSEKRQETLKVETKLDFWLVRNASLLCPPPPFCVLPAQPDLVQLRTESPPTPPPRAA
jgi:hypothetical protein